MSYRVLFFSRASNPLKVPPFIPRLRGGSLLAGRDKKNMEKTVFLMGCDIDREGVLAYNLNGNYTNKILI